jgi:hypothetical protein
VVVDDQRLVVRESVMRATAKYIDRVQRIDADVLRAIFTAILPLLLTIPAVRRLLDALLNLDDPEPPVAGG